MDRKTAIAVALSLALHGLLLGWTPSGNPGPDPEGPRRRAVSLRVVGPQPGTPKTGEAPTLAVPSRTVALAGATAPEMVQDRPVASRPGPSGSPHPRRGRTGPLPADPPTVQPASPVTPAVRDQGAAASETGSPDSAGLPTASDGWGAEDDTPGAFPGVRPGGHPLSGQGSGTPGGGDEESGPLREARLRYAMVVRQALSRSLAAPVALRRNAPSPDLALRVRIREDGQVLEAVPDGPCRDEGFCRRVREAALGLRDLPAPPGGPMEIRVPVRVQPFGSR